mmetsp:Transcript_48103/g.111390  ORF Transcript_48103/g.111390 Transcript_48103/m.111390 type:complete len:83 (+) Transcript_48103:35-283(+)
MTGAWAPTAAARLAVAARVRERARLPHWLEKQLFRAPDLAASWLPCHAEVVWPHSCIPESVQERIMEGGVVDGLAHALTAAA